MTRYLLLTIFFLPIIALGQIEYVPLVDANLETDSLGGYINSLYLLSVSIAGLLAVIKLVIAGAKYMLTDSVPGQGDAKKEIKSALLGLLLVISAVLILTIIDPDLVENDLTLERVDPTNSTPRSNIDPASPGATRAASNERARAAGALVSGGCNTRTTVPSETHDTTTLDFSGCLEGYDSAALLSAFSRECMSQNGGFSAGAESNKATCEVPKAGVVNSRYGRVTQTAETTETIADRADAVAQVAELRTQCEDKNGRVTVTNGPTGSFLGATVACEAPTVISYSGNTRSRNSWRGDCRTNNGQYEEGWWWQGIDICLIFP